MPLFKSHHDAPVDNTGSNYQSGGMNDPAYSGPNATGGYPSEQGQQGAYGGGPQVNTTSHPSGVGAPLDNSYGTQTTTHPSGVGAPVDSGYGNQTSPTHHQGHPGAATAGGAATGAMAGHELGGHAGPGAAVGGMAGNRASHQHNQPTSGYNEGGYNDGGYSGGQGGTGYNDSYGGQAGQTGAMNSNLGRSGTTGTNFGQPGAMGANTSAQNASTGAIDPKQARSLEMKGKAQQLAGIVLSSQSMKAKGAAKEQEAAALRHQAVNIDEAEKHEAAARAARERAVAHGAHPDHGELGGARNTY